MTDKAASWGVTADVDRDVDGPVVDEIPDDPAPSSDGKGSRSLWRSARAVWVLAAVGLAGLVVGYVLSGLLQTPAGASESAPQQGLLTAKVETGTIEATVVARADVGYQDQVGVDPIAQGGVAQAIVTGHLPAVGDVVNAGDVVVEVSGRPVFVLTGNFPAYRSLSAGSSGADVTQLRAALTAIGLNAGAVSDAYDAALADAVGALYRRAGYAPPGSDDPALAQAVRSAQDAVTDAQVGVTQAQKNVTQARAALDRANAAVASAQAAYDAAATEQALQALNQALSAAEQAASALDQAKNGLAAAQRSLTRAQQALTDAQRAAWPTVPLGAVVYASSLPLKVDQVNVKVGDDLGKRVALPGGKLAPAIVLAGSEIKVTANVGMDQAKLLKVGGPAVLTVPGGGEVSGVIASICEISTDAAARCPVGITISDFGNVPSTSLVGNLQVTMAVGTSSPDSLLVPVAAVSADTAGHARITIIDGVLQPGVAAADQKTIIVHVTTGLSANGMVEITSATPAIKAGDLVVIGQGAAPASPSSSHT